MASAQLAQLRTATQNADPFQELINRPMGQRFDPDAWHAMQERDNALIRDELLHGGSSNAFVYSFEVGGKKVTGVSVIGARELASQYKGIKSRIVATVEKRGALFIFRTFTPLSIETRVLHELEADEDFYECVTEVSDIKTGNSIEVRKKESMTEKKRDGTRFARQHYDVIAESKAFRNGVLSVLPQSVILAFKTKCLAAGNSTNEQTITQRREQVQRFAAKNSIAIDRQVLAELSFAELDGLGGAAREDIDAFKRAAAALGLNGDLDKSTGEITPAPPAPGPAAASKASAAAAPAAGPAQDNDWSPTPEEEAAIRAREVAEASGKPEAKTTTAAPSARRGRAPISAE